jgi:hypothetical protein
LFFLLVGIVEETIVLAGLGIGLAAGADLADELATGFFMGSFNVVHIHLLDLQRQDGMESTEWGGLISLS